MSLCWGAIAAIAVAGVVSFAATYGLAMMLTDWEDEDL